MLKYMKSESIGGPEDSALEEERQKELDKIRQLGPRKPMGYLPIEDLAPAFKTTVEKEKEIAEKSGYSVLIFDKDGWSDGGEGAIFVYHAEALREFLLENAYFLNAEGWPTDPKAFVEHVAKIPVERDRRDLFNVIAGAFGDFRNMEL